MSAINWPILTALIMDDYGSLDEKRTGRGNGRNLPQCHIFYYKFHVICPGIEP
jgi:hypothetical protein